MKIAKVLLDECTPKQLKAFLRTHGHECRTAQEMGWSGIQNGELLTLASPLFDVLVTIDQKIRYQQNMTGRPIAVIVLRGRSNRLEDLSVSFPTCAQVLQTIQPGHVIEIGPCESQ